MPHSKLPASFFQRPDVLAIARDLLGKHLCTNIDGIITAGRVVETEAYRHEGDNSLTMHLQRKRHQAQGLHVPGGAAYIYTVYNRYALFNIATHDAQHPDAVLIRAIEPTEGIEEMLRRRGLAATKRGFTAGPGLLSQALGITPALSGLPVTGEVIWFEDHGEQVADADVVASARVGLEYAGAEAAGLPWRFRIKDSKWTSPAK
ncbi:DNA-3-methyladenine glycosylase [Hymenobacter properus]|uniref:Putative 3-methyladenine DNA glycosylase n=1 Tax=Hymenobacter properus TaxID=2791026 RepID=A0A931BIN4_9BACT|nr:DNA-3-methyladenine glycosylase [Hymenobacter properus]MBF9143211.1 DNA-3-methyladenine glycosylase [Hymenobacter properus]MBR7722020.1 DNA-3-methyladenine glycosylase [Microvirga sp. SRT04]